MVRFILCAAFYLLSGVTQAYAAPQKYVFDKNHTQILFFVNHLGFSNSNGKFLKFEGGFTFDEAQPDSGIVDVTIDTNSLNMDDTKWDEHLKSKDFFNTAQYPTMTFKSTNVKIVNKKTATLTGDLTLLGQTKPVTLNVTLNKCGAHPMTSAPTCGFSAKGVLKRSDWGMKAYVPMVSDDIELRIEVEASADKKMNQ
jgi:polyisoprenoid-binding protein YceI